MVTCCTVDGVFYPRSCAPDHPNLEVEFTPGRLQKARKVHVFSNLAPENNICVYNSDIVTLEAAIKERVFFVKRNGEFVRPPLPGPGVIEARLARFRSAIRKHLPSTTPISRHAFAGLFVGRKKVVYELAVDSLHKVGVSIRDSYIKAFVKAEKGKPNSAPRVIQPRDPRYNVEVGRFVKPVEERIYKAVDRVFGDRTIMKGLNARQVGDAIARKWKGFSDPVAVGLDAHRFDQHVSRQLLEWEHEIISMCFRNPDERAELCGLLRWQLLNRGFGYCRDGRLRYEVEGCRMSGDCNTALGNCLDMCAMVYAYSEYVGVRCSLVNNGDDCVVIMEKHDVERFVQPLDTWFFEMGFTMMVEDPVYELEHIEFCQARPVFDGFGYTMVRNLHAFNKDACSLVPLVSDFTLKSWLASVGDGGMSLTGGIPIWQEYYSFYQRMAKTLSSKRRRRGVSRFTDQSAFETGMMMMARGMSRTYGDVSPQARYSFWLAFGVAPDHQVALEAQYRRLNKVVLNPHPAVRPIPMSGFVTAY